MLIALERRRRRAEEFLLRAREQRIVPVVPADVIVEWWRGRSDRREAILAFVHVELSPEGSRASPVRPSSPFMARRRPMLS